MMLTTPGAGRRPTGHTVTTRAMRRPGTSATCPRRGRLYLAHNVASRGGCPEVARRDPDFTLGADPLWDLTYSGRTAAGHGRQN